MADYMKYGPRKSWAKYLLTLLLIIGILVASYLAFIVWNKIRELGSAQHDHAEWVFTQLETDFLKLDRAIDQARSGKETDLIELRKRFDIFYSRTEVALRVQEFDELKDQIRALQSVLDKQIPLVDSADQVLIAGLGALSAALKNIETLPRQIGLDSISHAAKTSENQRAQIVQLIELLLLIVLGVTIALIGAIIRLTRQTSMLNRTSKEAERNHMRMATTLRASLDAVMVLSETGRIIDFNGSAESIFGIARSEALGQDYINLLVPPQLRDLQLRNLKKYLLDGGPGAAETGRHETEMVDINGRIFPVELSISLARSEHAPVFVTYIRDITDKHQKEKEIIRARDEALVAYQEKSRFFAMMSHEMRTPLNGVLSAIHLLDDNKLDLEQRKFVNAALTSGDILLGHIDDVLAIERSEADTNDKELQPCDVGALLLGLISTMKPLAEKFGTRLHLDDDGLSEAQMLTDPRSIQQILVNLISNAVKFSPDDDIVVVAFTENNKASGNVLHLEVVDNGPGIPHEDSSRIFEDYVSLDSRYERRTGGTGLGLGIVRRLVRRLGGEIECVSETGKGSRFIVRLPIVNCGQEKTSGHLANDADLAQTPPLTLLVVDDNEINRDLLKAMLERLSHKVVLAASGQAAIDLAAIQKFDAILMDISMPGMNGIQATQIILGRSGPNQLTPVMAVTAHALPNERAAFKAAGMSGFLQKPLDSKMIKSALKSLVSLDAAPFPAVEPAPIDATNKMLLNDTQVEELLDLLGHQELGERVKMLTKRVEVQMTSLIEAQETKDLQSKAHDLAGLCGMFGAERMHSLLEAIEANCKKGDLKTARCIASEIPAVWKDTLYAWESRLLILLDAG